MPVPADYFVDRGANTLVVCAHCDCRVIRAERRLAVSAMLAHLAAAHRDMPGLRLRIRRR